MSTYEILHVAITPPNTPDITLIKQIAAIINKDVYDTRVLITGELPLIVAHSQDRLAAEAMTQSLKELDLLALICDDSELRKSTHGFIAQKLEIANDAILFQDSNGHAKRLGFNDVSLIINGMKQTATDVKKTETKMKLSKATLLLTGIPIVRNVKEHSTDTSVQTEGFTRLYGLKSQEPLVEIRQHHMDYSFLGPELAPSSFQNFNTVSSRMRQLFPQAVFDDRITKAPVADANSIRLRDNPEINCKLIYLFHKAIQDRASD